MARRTILSLTLAALLLVATAGTALGGGWALTSLDPLDAPPRAGASTEVGYTVLQHGTTPARLAGTGIAIAGADGVERVFPGRPSGAPGHYVARVRFPSGGEWTWTARQGWFGPQELGAVTVADASPPVAAAPPPGGGDDPWLRWALLTATLAAAVALAAQLVAPAGRRRALRGLRA